VKESFGKSTLTKFGLIQQRLSAGYSDAKTNLFSSYTDLETEDLEPIVRTKGKQSICMVTKIKQQRIYLF
jgi:hypothetical protein